MTPSLVTIPNVPIVSTGEYHLASGKTTFTQSMMSAAIAAQDDPAVQTPRLKIGHEADLGDGEPAFGKIENMHLGDNGQTIYGDYVGVPAWLAELMPTAYPSRSIEGMFNETTSSGKTHELLITAVSLLGVVAPGVSTLDDLKGMYGAEQPAGVTIEAGTKVLASKVGGGMAAQVTAAVEVDDVRRDYYAQLGPDETWWWIRAIRLDPNELIVDDDEGGLYRVPFDVSGETVTFSDPVEVQIVYVDKASEKATAAIGAAGGGHPVAVFAKRSESRPDNEEKETSMDPKEIRASLGLAEDASDEEVKAKIKELRASETPETPEPSSTNGDGEEGDSEEDEETTPEGEPAGEPEGEETPSGGEETTASIDRGTLKQLTDDAKAGREAKARQDRKDRDDLIESAVKAGKFSRDRKDHWKNAYDKDPAGTKAAIESLEPGLIPVGDEHGTEGGDDVNASGSHYEDSWLSPGERSRIAAAKGGAGGTITKERE